MKKKQIFFRLHKYINILISIIIFKSINYSLCECDRNSPILKNEECQLIYCSENDFSLGVCSINNTIIKNQWLTDIKIFNDYKLRYCTLAINSKGDMIAEFSQEEADGIRVFYGLKQNGDFYFKNEKNLSTSTKIMKMENCGKNPNRYESDIIFYSLNNNNSNDDNIENIDNKEYLMSISLFEGLAEFYDFEKNNYSCVSTIEFTGYNIYSYANPLIEIKNINNTNNKEYLYIIIGQDKSDLNSYQHFYLAIEKFSFLNNTIELNDSYTLLTTRIPNVFSSRLVSSFITDSNIIVVFYLNYKYIIGLFAQNLTQINEYIFNSYNIYPDGNKGFFFKCIYLKEGIGAFIFFTSTWDNFPIFKILEIDSNYTIIQKNDFNISLLNQNYSFNTDPILGDLIKINDYRLIYAALSKDRDILYFLSYFFSNNYNKIEIKIYKIELNNLYNYTIFGEITTILYNNYLTLSSSVCNTLPCDINDKNSIYFSILIIFGYINNTDSFKDKYIDISLFLNNSGKNNLINTLQENAIINNNVFGYDFCQEIKLASIPDDLIFYNNKSLQGQNETIK